MKKIPKCSMRLGQNGTQCGKPAKVITVLSTFHGKCKTEVCDECRVVAGWGKHADTVIWDEAAEMKTTLAEMPVTDLRVGKVLETTLNNEFDRRWNERLKREGRS